MAKKQDKITLSEFRKAFNAAVPKLADDPDLPSVQMNKAREVLKKKLEAIFPSKSPSASLTASQFEEKSRAAISVSRKPCASRFTLVYNGSDHSTLSRIKSQMPTLQKILQAEHKKWEAAEQRRLERERQREASRPKKRDSVSDRLDKLERENESLRRRANSGMSEYEADRRAREAYEKDDTRIGGYKDPGTRIGLRD